MDDNMEITNVEPKELNLHVAGCPEHRPPTTNEVYIDVNSADDTYVESVLDECQKISRNMVINAIIATIVFLIVLLFQAACIWNSDRLYATHKNTDPVILKRLGDQVEYNMTGLYDNLQVVFGKWYGNEGFSIHYVDGFISALLILVIIKVMAFSPAIFSCQMFIRYMVLMSQLYVVRGIFILATVVPISRCEVLDLKQGFFQQYLHTLSGYLSIKRTCTDMIISGHAAGTTTLVQFFVVHNRRWNLNTIVVILASVIYCTLIAARSHYTIDVMFGIFFSIHIYSTHIHMVEHVGRKAVENRYSDDPEIPWISKVVARFELVNERVRLFIKLQQLRRMTASKPEGAHTEKLAYYCNIFGLDDDIDATIVYTGFDMWTTATFKLITRRFRNGKQQAQKRGEGRLWSTDSSLSDLMM